MRCRGGKGEPAGPEALRKSMGKQSMQEQTVDSGGMFYCQHLQVRVLLPPCRDGLSKHRQVTKLEEFCRGNCFKLFACHKQGSTCSGWKSQDFPVSLNWKLKGQKWGDTMKNVISKHQKATLICCPTMQYDPRPEYCVARDPN